MLDCFTGIDKALTVLEVKDHTVIVADPLSGKEELSFADFEKKWRYTGIVIQKKP